METVQLAKLQTKNNDKTFSDEGQGFKAASATSIWCVQSTQKRL